NAGPCACQHSASFPLIAVPAASTNGGPASGHAALGACLAMEFVSLSGPPQGQLDCYEAGQTQPCITLPTGEMSGAQRLHLSQNQGAPESDPYGAIAGRQFAVSQPGLYCLGFRLVDTSTNGPGGGAIHSPSPVYYVYLQAGLTIHSLTRQGNTVTALLGGVPGQSVYLERATTLGPEALWETVAGPLAGTARLQQIADTAAPLGAGFFRLRTTTP
ncbi:MAG TPA: hypothetical protein VEC99_14920, partial [Clostridia bacterium]|nr:hypothetical protein [Clostridia bacterium]